MTASHTTQAFEEQPLTLRVSGWDIPAALTVPAPAEAPGSGLASAILLVPGSLGSDVNGDYPAWNMRPHHYAYLARQLAARGHAVYRYAKLGPGPTGSIPRDATAAAQVRNWGGRQIIARAALAALHGALGERALRARWTILAGHSEGAVVVSLLAATPDAAGADGVVLLSGPSVGILDIMREQLALMTPERALSQAREDFEAAVGCVRRGEPIPSALRQRPAVRSLAAMDAEGLRYMRECDAADPSALAGAIDRPVLVVQGGRDTSVPPHHAARLVAARRDRPTDLLLLPELQHMYKPLPEGLMGPAAFALEGETDPRVAAGIDRWIRRLPAT